MTSYVLCKTGSLAVFKVTARDQGHYKGPLRASFVTYCNISCFFLFFFFLGGGGGGGGGRGGGGARLSDFCLQIIQFCAAVSVSTLRNDAKSLRKTRWRQH